MTGWYLLGSFAMLLANGFFVGAEFALIAARKSQIENLAEAGGRRARTALRSLRELSLMLAGAQLGITMASLGLGALAEPAVARLLERAIEWAVDVPSGVLHSMSFAIALAIVVFFHMVVGEIAPKNIAIAVPDRSILAVAVPFRLYINAFRPFIYLLNTVANGCVRILGVEPKDELTTMHTTDEIADLIARSAGGGMIEESERRLLTGAAGFSDRDAAAVMVPRTEMVAVPATATPADIEQLVLETGHSRFPVFRDDTDDITGFFHSKDLLKVTSAARRKALQKRFIRQMLMVPENRKLHPLMIDMRRNRQHFALVLDEHGGTAGIVSLEDILEELVGEIRDEYDLSEARVEPLGEGRYLVPGNLPVHEAAERLGLELPPGEYETVAGFLMDRLQRIPRRRDVVEHDGWRLRVLTMQRRRVVQVVIDKAE